MTRLRAMGPENVAHLFAPLHRELIELLRTLPREASETRTAAGRWRVRDVAAHLLDGDLRKLASHRDGHLYLSTGQPPRNYAEVIQLVNSLNAGGVHYAERLSTRLLIDLLDVTGRWVAEFVETLDPFAPALFPVAWAGESTSQNWMDTGREYTERWHHQMQIREAVGAPLLLDEVWYEPLLSFSFRAVPRAFDSIGAEEGTALIVEISDRAWRWSLVREDNAWRLYHGGADRPATTVRLRACDAWRLLFNAVDRSRAASIVEVDGDQRLGTRFLDVRSVMV